MPAPGGSNPENIDAFASHLFGLAPAGAVGIPQIVLCPAQTATTGFATCS